MRFHLVDRIDAYEPSQWIRARKVTSASEGYWQRDGDTLTMPSQLVLESLCQAGGWLITLSSESRKRAALAAVGAVEFQHPVGPGQVLILEATVDAMNDEMAVLSGRVTVEDRVVLTAEEVMCVLVDAAVLEDVTETVRVGRRLTNTDGA